MKSMNDEKQKKSAPDITSKDGFINTYNMEG